MDSNEILNALRTMRRDYSVPRPMVDERWSVVTWAPRDEVSEEMRATVFRDLNSLIARIDGTAITEGVIGVPVMAPRSPTIEARQSAPAPIATLSVRLVRGKWQLGKPAVQNVRISV